MCNVRCSIQVPAHARTSILILLISQQVEVAALQMPAGAVLRDLAWYKSGQLALVLQKAGKPVHLSELHLVATADLEYAPVPSTDETSAEQARHTIMGAM